MGNNLHISLSSIFMGFCCSTLTLAVPKVSSSSNPLFSALTGSTFFSIFAAFVLCLNDVSDQVQSTAVLTAFLHQSAALVSSKPLFFPLLFSYCTRGLRVYCCNYAFRSCFHVSHHGFKLLCMFSIMYLFIVNYFKYSYFPNIVF